MPPRATGTWEAYPWKDGQTVTYRARVRHQGQRYRIDLGTNHEGWNDARAQAELERIIGQIQRGTWQPPEKATPAPVIDQTEKVSRTVTRWWRKREPELAPKTRTDYRWRVDHILRHLYDTPVTTLDARAVDDFRLKLRRAGLSPRSVNMVLGVLAQVLDDAVDYKLLPANPARGARRREKVPKPSRVFLEPDMVIDLLDAAGEWERALPVHQHYGRRAFLATLCLAGPRITELTDADRGGLDVHAGVLRLGKKTAAGRGRHLELSAFLTDELRGYLAAVPGTLREAHGARLPVFPTRTGGRLNASNVRNRLLTETVRRANEKRAREGRMLLPERVTPHALRRTFASLCFFAGRDLRWVMGQLGHDDPRMTLGVYAQVLKRRRIDYDLVWQLVRFTDEPEIAPFRRTIGSGNDPTGVHASGLPPRQGVR